MSIGWKKERARITPDAVNFYQISAPVIEFTEQVLLQYGKQQSEGLVYWAGYVDDNRVFVNTCIAPKINATRYNIEINHEANFRVVQALIANGVKHLGQVHSHPFEWVDHSPTDDRCAAFKTDGLLSLVVPNFCEDGMTPLSICGVHIFAKKEFHRIKESYVNAQFQIDQKLKPTLIDLRNEK